MPEQFATVDEYIASFPAGTQAILQQVRRTIHAAAPGAGEKISYRIPTITLAGRSLLHFSGWKSHISLYPVPDADADLDRELEPYKAGKGTLRFPLNKPIPYDLIGRIAQRFVELHDR